MLLLFYVLITGNHRKGIRQRLTLYPHLVRKKTDIRVWVHAASIGEVQAASLLIAELRKSQPGISIVLTTMTIHGREFASGHLKDVTCLLAPLDMPGLVGRAVGKIRPDAYVCLETELWPLLLRTLRRHAIPVILANGRMSLKTVATYQKHSWFFRTVLDNFSRLCLISQTDRERFAGVGIAQDRLEVTGNIKFDQYLPDNVEDIQISYRRELGVGEDAEIFICGSTHEDEEQQLLGAYQKLCKDGELLWLLAPRHLQRLDSIRAMFKKNHCEIDLFSKLRRGVPRQSQIVLIDTFGDLFKLYSIATYVFCGGSLVPRRGHNIMEPALWGKPVFYGPSMDDFRDGVELLESDGCGFTIHSPDELVEKVSAFRTSPEEYERVCRQASKTARAQQGAAVRQADVVCSYLGRSH